MTKFKCDSKKVVNKKSLKVEMIHHLGIVDSDIESLLSKIESNPNVHSFLIGYIAVSISKGSSILDFKKMIQFIATKL